jgi:ribosomal protein S18 acetylase RimI-like enzyme
MKMKTCDEILVEKDMPISKGEGSVRPTLKQDNHALISMMRETKIFKDEEIKIAEELLQEYLRTQNPTDYRFYSYVTKEGEVCGFACFGSTHITKSTYDFYWLVVSPSNQRKGVGTNLLKFVEQTIINEGGKLILVETSSIDSYAAARRFYEYNGYRQLAKIHAYYDVNDDLVIYGKYF